MTVTSESGSSAVWVLWLQDANHKHRFKRVRPATVASLRVLRCDLFDDKGPRHHDIHLLQKYLTFSVPDFWFGDQTSESSSEP